MVELISRDGCLNSFSTIRFYRGDYMDLEDLAVYFGPDFSWGIDEEE